MRILPLFLALLLAPAAAQAGIDFKCTSLNSESPISGWLRFGFSGREGNIELEYWANYPPISLVNAALDNGRPEAGKIRYISQTDRHNGTIATVDVPPNGLQSDMFAAKVKTRTATPAKGMPASAEYSLNCVRH